MRAVLILTEGLPAITGATPAARLQSFARDVTISAATLCLALSPMWLLPGRLEHCVYLFGMGAILVCAGLTGLVSVAATAIAVVILGLMVDDRAGLSAFESYVRAGSLLLIASGVAVWAKALRHHQRTSASAIADLAREEAVIRSILDTGPNGILVIDRNGVVSSYSAGAEALFGWTAEEVIGRNVKMLMPPPYDGEHDGYVARYLETGERKIIGQRREMTGLRKDGSLFPMELHVGEIKLGDERHFTGFVHDLTALYDANRHSDELRTQLTYLWRMNSLGEMAAVLAHELNQPLAAIANYMRGVRNIVTGLKIEDDELIDALDETASQAIRAGEIIRRTRAMVAREENEKERASLSALIKEMEPMMALAGRDVGVVIRHVFAEEPDDLVVVDRIQIQQVVGNLMRNAIDAMSTSEQRVLEVRTERSPDGWVVRIEDSGPGISDALSGQLFRPLASTKPKGMGLGLSISRTIVDHHGGQIWVEKSRLGGAAFCFSLPVAESA